MSLNPSAAVRGLIAVALAGTAALSATSAHAANVDINALPTHTTEAEDRRYRGENVPTVACPKVNVVIARGTDEPKDVSPALDGYYNGGLTGPDSPAGAWHRIATELHYPTEAGAVNYTSATDVLRTDLSYAASLQFQTSVPSGSVRLMNYLTQITNRCADTQFVLLGFSQGALVIGNAVLPISKRVFWNGNGTLLSTTVLNRIRAIGFVANPAFARFFNDPNLPSLHAGPMITSGYAAGTIPDVGRQMNDGNYHDAYHGVMPRPLNAYPVATTASALPGQVVYPGLTEDIEKKIRDYCEFRDWACQNSNPNNSLDVHGNTAYNLAAKQNLAIWAIKRLRFPNYN